MARFLKILGTILFTILSIALILMIATVALFRKDTSAPSIFGYQFVLMSNEYMGDSVPNGSLITAKKISTEQKTGDVLVYHAENESTLQIGRIIDKESVSGELVYTLKMDKGDSTAKVSQNNVSAVVVGVSTKLGTIIRFSTSFRGVFVIALVPCMLLILLEIIISLSSKQGKESNNITEDNKNDKEEIAEYPKKDTDKVIPETELEKVISQKTKQKDLNKKIEDENDDIVVVKAGDAANMFADAQKKNPQKKENIDNHSPTEDEKNRVVDSILDEVESNEIKLGL